MNKTKHIYISCIDSGPNPVAGIGIAKSIKDAFPNTKITGVDYSPRSTGLHHPIFDDVVVQRPWDEIDLELYKTQIMDVLKNGAYWISSLDVETKWLSKFLSSNPRYLGPTEDSITKIHKPRIEILCDSDFFKIPAYIMVLEFNEEEQELFCREYGWKVWLKSKYFEAQRVFNVYQLRTFANEFRKRWPNDELFLQEDVAGQELSYCFVAYKGEVQCAVKMVKKLITTMGKTWGGVISACEPVVFQIIQNISRTISWNGASEIECVVTPKGDIYVIDYNPRFPAWIYGATLAGFNLPAILFASHNGELFNERGIGGKFVRVVEEIKCNESISIPPIPETWNTPFGRTGKMASDMPALSRKMVPLLREPTNYACETKDHLVPHNHIIDADSALNGKTPRRICNSQAYISTLQRIMLDLNLHSNTEHLKVDVRFAYSIKTFPNIEALTVAKQAGMMAEAISADEIAFARKIGFDSDQIIVNGPGKFWPSVSNTDTSRGLVFFDSITEAEELLKTELNDQLNIIGFRLNLSVFPSRFGVPVENASVFERLIILLKKRLNGRPLAFHFHATSSIIGISTWETGVLLVSNWIRSIQELTGANVKIIDLGGGWHPYDFIYHLPNSYKRTVLPCLQKIRGVEIVIFEPGRALTQSLCSLVVRVIGVRETLEDGYDIICDGSVAEMPIASEITPHVWKVIDGKVVKVDLGRNRILGRICMENDVLARGIDTDDIRVGDVLIISCAGGYNSSMAYEFGRASMMN